MIGKVQGFAVVFMGHKRNGLSRKGASLRVGIRLSLELRRRAKRVRVALFVCDTDQRPWLQYAPRVIFLQMCSVSSRLKTGSKLYRWCFKSCKAVFLRENPHA